MTQASGPLSGVRVLDLSRVLAGPWATQVLADLGAEVIKIERPGAGDDTRSWGPPFLKTTDGGRGDAAYFLSANRGKKSVTLDIATEEGAAIARDLAATCDVVIENFKTGGLKKYGLDHASLTAAHPKLVYCSITGFGQDGPDAARPGYDYMIQAMGGLMSITGQADGAPGAEPMKVGVAVVDLFTGMYASNAILAALLHARATGEGQHIDLALFDVQAAMLANQATNYFASGKAPTRMGNAHPNLAPYQPFPCNDGMIVVAVGNDGQFRAFAKALGRGGNGDRSALRLQCTPDRAPRRPDGGDLRPDRRADDARADRGAGCRRGAVRAGQYDRSGVRGAAGDPSRPRRRTDARRSGRAGEDRRLADPPVEDPRRL
jgi:crotonobetainyl-CoA:carnitine CoA-transferase CaiB-like acyl-CoA transferase